MARSDEWHKADIKAALEKSGTTMAALARQHDIDPSAVSQAINGSRPMTRVKALVANAIDVPPQIIWPRLFDDSGQPIPTRRRLDQRSTRGSRRNVSGSRHRAA